MIKSLIRSLFIFNMMTAFIFSEEEEKKIDWEIADIATDGHKITLNGTSYEVSPPDWQVAVRWSHGVHGPHYVAVVNTRNGNLDYPIDIKNKANLETIQVRFPKTVEHPQWGTEEAPSEDDESD